MSGENKLSNLKHVRKTQDEETWTDTAEEADQVEEEKKGNQFLLQTAKTTQDGEGRSSRATNESINVLNKFCLFATALHCPNLLLFHL